MTQQQESLPDPGGVQAAIDRYRDIAKYVIGIFAAIGALLVAGTQLSSIGKLSYEDDAGRLAAAVIALAFAIGAVVRILHEAIKILRPVEISLADVAADDKLRKDVEARPSLLGGADSVEDLQDQLASDLLEDDERKGWLAVADEVMARGAYKKAQICFDAAWKPMLGAALVGAAAIAVFAWAANPPESETADPVMRPDPVELTFTLTDDGRQTLSGELGEECVKGEIAALSIGGKEGAPRVVTLPTEDCETAQFTLDPELGTPIAADSAPAK